MDTLMQAVKKASAEIKKRQTEGVEQGKTGRLFETNEEGRKFFEEYFKLQEECTDLELFMNIVSQDLKYNLTGGAIIKGEK